MLFRGSLKKINSKNKKFSLPGNTSTCRNSAPRSFGIASLGRVAFCISRVWKQGSLTIEAAFVLPLFFLTVVSLVGMMGIYSSYSREMVALQQKAEELAMAQIYTSGERSSPVRLYGTVEEDLPLLPFSADILHARVAASVLPWTGRSDYSSLEPAASSDGRLYYLSDYQSVYHTSSCCSYLSLQLLAVETGSIGGKTNAYGEHYGACEKCVGAGGTGSVVYVTENGDHYHNSPECSGLKRSIHLVEESDIAGLHMCSRCSKREEDV